ncbi:DUF6000 family protein [Streptomyces sp. NPDC058297]|uniref:DUF6000 family protein n=1 Tax=Streptomyces sp. NPDC058297 TaxID=3346433 RepID=UPI0036E9FF94
MPVSALVTARARAVAAVRSVPRGGGRYRGAFCIALATFGTTADVDLVCRYLDRYLPQPDLVRDQTEVLSTLLHLDAVLGTERAPYLAAGGLWQQWTDATPNMVRDPQEYRKVVDQLCSFASECAELLARMETRR